MTMTRLNDAAFDQLFRTARSHPTYADKAIDAATLEELSALAGLAPTAFNQQPLRVLYITSEEGKAKLDEAIVPGNKAKVAAAPAIAIFCYDANFVETLPKVFPLADVRGYFADPAGAAQAGQLNALIQSGMFIAAARGLGLGMGPMIGFDAAKVKELFLADNGWQPLYFSTLGYVEAQPEYDRLPRLGFEEVAKVA
ncbi:malonic semialdehyde reductase [Falsigemmobacter intermedius]|uniref:Malonic semialdehyde reductase n=2 Tax=Falsigemmobacter intermedius TaxID=1553448 RepID=A0A3S3UII5_9RHOB|nr:malonic semialdehyde reductase [Falsigemmobacter intermedius]